MKKIIVGLGLGLLVLAGCGNEVDRALETDGLYVEDVLVGSGDAVQTGDYVRVNYVGYLYEDGQKGEEFDRSHEEPLGFTVGRGEVVAGWDQGMVGMRPGGKRTLIVAPRLGYGDADLPRVPGGSTLLYEVELVDVPRVEIEDLEVGQGAEVAPGDFVKVHYTGWLYTDGEKGEQFDSSRDRDEPFVFQLGKGQVIKGWDQGLAGMRVGGKRRLIVPPELGYGDRGTPNIPGGATLLFEVEVLDVPEVQIETLTEGEGPAVADGDVIKVHYTGWLRGEDGQKGEKVDSSLDRNRLFTVKVGAGKVIPGWEKGLLGMKPGEHRRLIIPPELAYGSRGARKGSEYRIPPGATLIFEIELVEIVGQAKAGQP